jgi:hypothetical protein
MGTSNPIRLMDTPSKVEIIKGFFENLFTSVFTLELFSPSSLYSSNTEVAVITLTKLIVDANSAANLSGSPVPKANTTKGIPKKARLPKTVVTINR